MVEALTKILSLEAQPKSEAANDLLECEGVMAFDEHIAQRVRDILSEECVANERRMFGGLAFMVKGHMCCGIMGQDLVVRIGADEHEKALSQPHVRAMDFTGRPMKGFVYLSPPGYRSKANLRKWVRAGLRFVSSLPPK